MIILSILIGLFCGILIYFILMKMDQKALPPIDFFKEKNNALNGLKEKKDSYQKEISAETEEKLRTLKQQIDSLQDSYNNKELVYKEKFQQLSENFIIQQENYKKLDEESAKERQKKIVEQISNEQESYNKRINEIESSYKEKKQELDNDFFLFSETINSQKEILYKEIEDYENRQKEIIARFKKDEEVRQQQDFYHIEIDFAAQQDIEKLKNLAIGFNKPEILFKLIYEVYYKAALEELFKRVLGDNKNKSGIYKITNISNQKVYVGKSVKLLERWRTHAKRGCGIERIKGQLYDAMFKEGLQNFTWEIIELCDKEELNEKEKYWINFYNSIDYGYNIKSGG